jgi:hypothetical protein
MNLPQPLPERQIVELVYTAYEETGPTTTKDGRQLRKLCKDFAKF